MIRSLRHPFLTPGVFNGASRIHPRGIVIAKKTCMGRDSPVFVRGGVRLLCSNQQTISQCHKNLARSKKDLHSHDQGPE